MTTLHLSSPGPAAVRPNFPPGNFTLFQRIFGAISVNAHGELLKLIALALEVESREVEVDYYFGSTLALLLLLLLLVLVLGSTSTSYYYLFSNEIN